MATYIEHTNLINLSEKACRIADSLEILISQFPQSEAEG